VDKVALEAMPAFQTVDGSTIRELAGPQPGSGPSRHQSLAEATVAPGGETAEHYHPRSEEIYYFVAGSGRMRLGEQEGPVAAGDCVVIAPGTPHKLWATGEDALVLLCCCAPPYSDGDTVMTGG
jgi:mannose-6-phosphate isomerase-like protein (cupin superfamily)